MPRSNVNRDVILCSLGRIPADVVIKNVELINLFTEEIYTTNIAIKGKYIARIGDVSNLIGEKTTVIDCSGLYAAPAFIDAHIHIESSLLNLTEFAKAVIPHGTGSIITDIHELANVLGIRAIELILEESKNIPLNMFIMVPSCVPAAPNIDTSGATITSADIEDIIDNMDIIGLGEMMNYPGVLNLDSEVIRKIETALRRNKIVDGHAPLLLGERLQAYISAGIMTDHESTTEDEALEKVRLGMYLLVREGSVSKNLDIIRNFLKNYAYLTRCIIVSDDKHADDLLRDGHLEPALRKAIDMGIDPVKAIKMVTLKPALA